MQIFGFWINLISNILTIVASSIGIFVFIFKRNKVASAFNFILNYSYQLTLADMKYKIERLNDFNVNDQSQKNEIINILNEIDGQINGNEVLKSKLGAQLSKVLVFTNNTKLLTEPKKRSLVSELKESLRGLDVSNFNNVLTDNIRSSNENS